MTTIKTKAHGRVNLIGEHTDYNGGFVLPTAIPQYTEITLTPRTDQAVHIRSSEDPKVHSERDCYYQLGEEKKNGTWLDYLAGGTHLLLQGGFKLQGFDIAIRSTVPEGSGLSSSAALEVAFLKAIREAFQLKLTDEAIA
ncbi:MAG: galactokinase, partial [Bdellovibrionales bacterium]|nr:galactokinase [Oligoflexia bacterium]